MEELVDSYVSNESISSKYLRMKRAYHIRYPRSPSRHRIDSIPERLLALPFTCLSFHHTSALLSRASEESLSRAGRLVGSVTHGKRSVRTLEVAHREANQWHLCQ